MTKDIERRHSKALTATGKEAIAIFDKALRAYYSKSHLKIDQAHRQFINAIFAELCICLKYTPTFVVQIGPRFPDFRSLLQQQQDLRNKYPAEYDAMRYAFACYILALIKNPAYTDIFSETFMSSQSKVRLAQHFTPPDLCYLTAALQMTNDSVYNERQKKIDEHKSQGGDPSDLYFETFKIGDWCAGAGAMPLGSLRVLSEHYPDQVRHHELVMNDIDEECSMIALIQFLMPLWYCEDVKPFKAIHVYRGDAITEYTKFEETKIASVHCLVRSGRIDFYVPKDMVTITEADAESVEQACEAELEPA